MSLSGAAVLVTGATHTLCRNIVSVSKQFDFDFKPYLFNPLSTGVNCTKEDLDALTNSNSEVDLLDFNDNELYFEKTYK